MESPPNRVPAGERPREIRFNNVKVNFYEDVILHIDENYFLAILDDVDLWFGPIVELRRSTKTSKPVAMPRNEGSTWNMELTILFYSEGKLISQIDHNLDQSQYSATSMRRSELYGEVIDIEVKFRLLQGLGIKPLRDYQVPTPATDVALCVEEKKFHVSKGALASESPYFEFLFYGPFVEKNQSEVLIGHVSAETMTALLDVVDGQFYWPPGKEALSDLLNAADRFIVAKVTKKVEDLCINFEDYGSLNRAEMFQLAETYNMNILKAILEVKSEQETLEPLERNEQNDSYGYSDDNIGDSYGYSDDNIGIDDWFRDDYRGELEAYDPWD